MATTKALTVADLPNVLVDVAYSGDYADLTNTPVLADVATSGDYNDLINTPTTPTGTIASQDADDVAITGGSITGITDLAVADGGTGASTAADARTNLGLGTAATTAATDYATAAQGTKADSALQPAAIGTTVQAYSPVLSSYATNGVSFKNRIINGDMRIDQRRAGSTVTFNGAEGYTLDRWLVAAYGGGIPSVQQSTTAPAGFVNSLGITVSTADTSIAAGDLYVLTQKIEGNNTADLAWGTASAKSITVSFKVRSSLTGTFSGAVANATPNRYYPFTFTINSANTFEDKVITIPGDTTGTWGTGNGTGLELRFDLGSGTNFKGTAGAWGSGNIFGSTGSTNLIATSGATWYLTGVQLEVGSSATPFDTRAYGTELALCQRYYETVDGIYSTSYQGASNRTDITNLVWKITKRAAPTLALINSTINTGSNTPSPGGGANAIQSFYISGAGMYVGSISGTSEL